MAKAHFSFGCLAAPMGEPVRALMMQNNASEEIAASASNQQTTAVAGARDHICRVSVDTASYVAFGTSPNASTGTGTRVYMPANTTEWFGVVPGWKAAVITA